MTGPALGLRLSAVVATVLALTHAKPLEFLLEWHNGIGRTPVWSAAAARALTLEK